MAEYRIFSLDGWAWRAMRPPQTMLATREMQVNDAVGFLETTGFSPALVAMDQMEKSGQVRLLEAELNDFLGICLKIQGRMDDVRTALEAGRQVAEEMRGEPRVHLVTRPHADSWRGLRSPREYNPLIQQDVVTIPPEDSKELTVATTDSQALGLIETQGFTAVFAAIDSACKAANVEVIGKEKLGGGYVTVIIRGDVAAVTAAVEVGREQVSGLGTMIAAHIIARPSPSVLKLLPVGG